MTLEVTAVRGEPTVSLTVVGAQGAFHYLTIYSGTCAVERSSGGLLTRRSPVRLGFYPDGVGPHVARHALTAHATLSLAWFESVSGGNNSRRRYGASDIEVQLVVDRTTNGVFPYVAFTALGAVSMELSYKVTVNVPAE